MKGVLTVEQAWRKLASLVPDKKPPEETLSVIGAVDRVLATDAIARCDNPPGDTSAMDGFALRAADLAASNTLPVSQRVAAGDAPGELQTGTAARIFTGARVPAGADAVVIQENCEFSSDSVSIQKPPRAGDNIRKAGEDIKSGSIVLAAGRKLRPPDIGLLITAGITSVDVYRRPRVAVVATGNELVAIGEPLPEGSIYESNSPMIAALLGRTGCEANLYRSRDTLAETVSTLSRAIEENDAVLTIGGVSVGEEDHVRAALSQLGKQEFWKIALKPGKPFLFGWSGACPIMGLPGNPVSAFVTFSLFCRPFLNAMRGTDFKVPRFWSVTADFTFERLSDRQQFLRGHLDESQDGARVVRPLSAQGSAMQKALALADVLISIPAETSVQAGDTVQVVLLDELTGF